VPYRYLTSERRRGVEWLTLNRPDVRNAFDDVMVGELASWAEAVGAERDVRAIVIAGAGPVFCAGGDLAWMAKTVEFTEAENVEDARAASRMFSLMDTLPCPVIGRVHGAALGGGAGLAAVCDIVIAEESAAFGFTEVKLGIIPAVIAPFALKKIGRSAARELFLTGRRFSAQHALEIGLVHRVVTAGELDRSVDRVVDDVLSSGPQAVAAAKQLIRDVFDCAPEEAMELTARALAARRVSEEGQHGLRAFLERRRPRWNAGGLPADEGARARSAEPAERPGDTKRPR
jgi:methylglutaconyl-CoA hydratase